jgi:hypothetical protein
MGWGYGIRKELVLDQDQGVKEAPDPGSATPAWTMEIIVHKFSWKITTLQLYMKFCLIAIIP